jgi:signal transduction histidine kinase
VRGYVVRPGGIALLATIAGAVLASLASLAHTSPQPLVATTAMTNAVAVPAFLMAGVLRLARWRITGESHCALRGGALILMGGLALPSVALARNLAGPDGDLTIVTFVRAVTAGVVLYVMSVALSDDESDRVDLERTVFWLTATTAAATVLLLTLRDRVPPSPTIEPTLADGVDLALAIAWLTVAVAAVVKSRDAHWARPAAPFLGAMGLAAVLRVPDSAVTTLVAAALTAAVGVLVASSALVDLVRAAQDERDETHHLTRELAQARDAVWTREARQEELTHDARSTLAGIRAAVHILDRQGDRLDPATVEQLRAATLAELSHLEHMLVRQTTDTDVFDVSDVVRTVTDVRRAAGLELDVTLEPALVRGVPGDLATVLQNLLVNAHEHAPGSRVSVVVRTVGPVVHVTVSDDGPGIPAEAADTAFDRGFRGSDSRGSGLGLSIARALARQQGGELELARTGSGASFVLSLPVATSVQVVAS